MPKFVFEDMTNPEVNTIEYEAETKGEAALKFLENFGVNVKTVQDVPQHVNCEC